MIDVFFNYHTIMDAIAFFTRSILLIFSNIVISFIETRMSDTCRPGSQYPSDGGVNALIQAF